MVTRHLLDSLCWCRDVRGPLLDSAAGGRPARHPAGPRPAGFAGQVLDSNGRRRAFLRHAVRALKLGNVEVVEALDDYRPQRPFAALTSRAFASLK